MRLVARDTSRFVALTLVVSACGTSAGRSADQVADPAVETVLATAETIAPGATSAPPATRPTPTSTTPHATPTGDALGIIEGMVLHLPDVAPGATIGDDSSCGTGISSEGDDNAFQDLVASIRGDVGHCLNQLEAPETSIDSLAVMFPDEQAASAASDPDVLESLIGYFAMSCCSIEDEFEAFVAADAPGDEAWEFRPADDHVALIAWRTGATVGALAVRHHDRRRGALAEGRRLAAIQAERMLAPEPVDPDIDDDSLVAAERAGFETWWLGEAASLPGRDAVALITTDGDAARVAFGYDGDDGWLTIENFDLSAIADGTEARQILDVADELFDSPCTVAETLDHPDGSAVLQGRFVPPEFFGPPTTDRVGWGSLIDGACPVGEPNVWMVTATLGEGTLVRIGAPFCYFCLGLTPPEGDPAAPAVEMRAIVEALIPFEPTG